MSPGRDASSGPAAAPRLPWWYRGAAGALAPFAAAWGQDGDREARDARRGLGVPRGSLWLHAASAGEASGAAPLVAEIRARRAGESILVSALTPSGRAVLARTLPELPRTAPPLDAPSAVSRALDASGARRLLLLETELWPAWLAGALERGLAIAVVNARLSDRAWPRYRRLRSWFAPWLARFAAVAAQSERDAGRWQALGVPEEAVRVCGNTKHDRALDAGGTEAREREEARRALGLDDGGPWCVWGSFRPGEEPWLEAALAVPGLRLLVVPRHPDRWPAPPRTARHPRVRWLAELGVLERAYRAGDLAVVGGTFAGHGGHNPLEPAARGLPVALGRSIENCRPVADALLEGGGARPCAEPAALTRVLSEWCASEEARTRAGAEARRAAIALAGASRRSVTWLEQRGFWR